MTNTIAAYLKNTHLGAPLPAPIFSGELSSVEDSQKQVECTRIRTRACAIESDDHAKKIPQRRDRSTQRTQKWRAYEPTFVNRGKCTAMVDSVQRLLSFGLLHFLKSELEYCPTNTKIVCIS